MSRFDDKTVIVTGGARGMGANHVRGFAAEGAAVIIADVLEDDGEALAAEVGAQAAFAHLDVTSEDGWAETVALAERTFGPVDVLVNNAGILSFASIDGIQPTGVAARDAGRSWGPPRCVAGLAPARSVHVHDRSVDVELEPPLR